jgi:hypothetical protein
MKRSSVRTCLCAVFLCLFSAASTAAEWSEVTKIVAVTTVDGMKVLRLGISPDVASNPAACAVGPSEIDVQVESGDGSETQRLLLSAVQLAFLTGRNVQLYLREDRCSTAGTPSRLRVAAGVRVTN